MYKFLEGVYLLAYRLCLCSALVCYFFLAKGKRKGWEGNLRGEDGERRERSKEGETWICYIYRQAAIHINLGSINGHWSLAYHVCPFLSFGPAMLVKLNKADGFFLYYL